jgi:hypothetical protein
MRIETYDDHEVITRTISFYNFSNGRKAAMSDKNNQNNNLPSRLNILLVLTFLLFMILVFRLAFIQL